jgi:hypothetical protein
MHTNSTARAEPDKARRLVTDTEDLNACLRFLARFVFAADRPPISYSVGPWSPRVVARPNRRRFTHAQLAWACEEWTYPRPSRRTISVETMRTACTCAGLQTIIVDDFLGVHIGEGG